MQNPNRTTAYNLAKIMSNLKIEPFLNYLRLADVHYLIKKQNRINHNE